MDRSAKFVNHKMSARCCGNNLSLVGCEPVTL